MINPTERLVDTNGVQLRVTEAGDRGAPVVVLAHGFPELAYSWRHQIPALADAGYHVLAPDQRGYGGSAKPAAVEDYGIVALTADIAGLLDDVGAEKATIIGHDWGAIVAWTFPLLYPDRVAAVAGLSVPPVPRSVQPPGATFRQTFGDNFFYILYFQQPGVADAELARDPATTMRRMLTHFGDGRRRGGAADVRAGAGGVHRSPARARRPAGLDQRRRIQHLRRRIHPQRVHRAAELVPQHGSQLGTDGVTTRGHHHRARVVHRGIRRPGARLHVTASARRRW